MSKSSLLKEMLEFIIQGKKYWLAPFIIIFVILSLLAIFTQTSVVAPFIYTIF